MAKRALLAALTAIGLVLLVLGAWFTSHLGSSGSATFTTTPAAGSVVVLEPGILSRVERPVTITAVAAGGGPLFMGVAGPADAKAIVGGADRTTVTGAHVRDWTLTTTRSGAGPAPELAGADIWRQVRDGRGTVRVTLDEDRAPESVVLAKADGSPADLSSLTVTIERRTWFFQALLAALVGLLATVAGAAGLWHELRHRGRAEGPGPSDDATPGPGDPDPRPGDADPRPGDSRSSDAEVSA
jgi:hypothetical protein